LQPLARYLSHQYLQTSDGYAPLTTNPTLNRNVIALGVGSLEAPVRDWVEHFVASQRVAPSASQHGACMLALLEHVLDPQGSAQLECHLVRPSQLWQPGSGLAGLLPDLAEANNQSVYLLFGQDVQGTSKTTCSFDFAALPPFDTYTILGCFGRLLARLVRPHSIVD